MCADNNCQVGGKPEVVWRQNFKILQNFFLQSKTDCTSAQSNIPVAAQSRPQFFFVDEIYEIKDGGSQVCWKPKVVGDAAAALRPLQGRLGRRLPHGTDQPGYHHHHQQQQKHHHHHQQQIQHHHHHHHHCGRML